MCAFFNVKRIRFLIFAKKGSNSRSNLEETQFSHWSTTESSFKQLFINLGLLWFIYKWYWTDDDYFLFCVFKNFCDFFLFL